MNKALVAIVLGFALSGVAFAQQKPAKEQIVGAWTLESVTSEMDDGKKGEPFGPSPKGVIIFSNDGHFSLFQSRAELPKIAANDRAKATPEEAQSIVASSIAYYGTYSIDENTKVMVVNLAASTYANVAANSQPEENDYSANLRRAQIRQSPNSERHDAANHMEARGGALEYFMHGVHRAARLQGEKTIDRFPRTTCRRLRGEANGVKIAPSPMAQP